MATIDPELLEILACPACKTSVVLLGEALQCTNKECRRRYPIQEDIPIMLIEEAQILPETSWAEEMKAAGNPS